MNFEIIVCFPAYYLLLLNLCMSDMGMCIHICNKCMLAVTTVKNYQVSTDR